MKDINEQIQHAKKGDRTAFNALYHATVSELWWYCRRLCGNTSDAEDLLQDTYLTAWRKLSQYRENNNFAAWLRTIARNTWLNRLRKEKPQLLTDAPAENTPEDELLGPEHQAEQKMFQEIMQRIIDESLSPPQKMTILLYYYDQKTIPEIAAEMDCSEGTVKSRLYHARRKLREALEQQGYSMTSGVPMMVPVLLASAKASALPDIPPVTGQSVVPKAAAKVASGTLKTKLIAGAAAVVVAGGALYLRNAHKPESEPEPSAIVETTTLPEVTTAEHPIAATAVVAPPTEETTESAQPYNPQPGGELVTYTFPLSACEMAIPEKFLFHNALSINTHKEQVIMETRICNSLSALGSLDRFEPDDGSGDKILTGTSVTGKDPMYIADALETQFDTYEIIETRETNYPVIPNSNLHNVPEYVTAERTSFTAEQDGRTCTGFAIRTEWNIGEQSHVMLMVFCDFSGIRTEEFAEAEASLRYRRGFTTLEDMIPKN